MDIKIIHKKQDVTELVSKISWEGSINNIARKVTFDIVVSSTDYFLPKVTIMNGDLIDLVDKKGQILYRGHVFSKSKSNNNNTMQVVSYDRTIYLAKNKATYNFKNLYPKQITERICRDFNIPTGTLSNPSNKVSRIFNNISLYEVIMTSYTLASQKNNIKYHANFKNHKLNIIPFGKNVSTYILSEDSNIINSTYSESIENMVNRIKLYDDKNRYKGKVENKDDIKRYGLLQEVYKGKEFNKQKSNLKGLERSASIEAIGDITCITGNAVYVKESFTGLTGMFYIISDSHKFENGLHKMNLNLSFVKMMDEKLQGSIEEKKR